MEWTQADTDALVAFKGTVDSDDIKLKEQIKKILLNNRFIIHVLNNEELEAADAEADDYFGINILPYYLINPTQTTVENFICYEAGYEIPERYNGHRANSLSKKMHITFYVLCHHRNLIDKETGVARHDLLTALLQYEFNYTTRLGDRLQLISDAATVVDNDYACRTLVFTQVTDNNVVKTFDGVPTIINKEVREYVGPT